MRPRPMLLLAAAVILTAAPDATFAQHASAVVPGMSVIGPQGGHVGVVKGIKGGNLLIATGRHETWIPRASFTVSRGALLFALTKTQLDAEIEKWIAAQSSVAPGAPVKGLAGQMIGKIESVGGDSVIIILSSGDRIQVAKDGIRGNVDGSATIGLTAEQVAARVSR